MKMQNLAAFAALFAAFACFSGSAFAGAVTINDTTPDPTVSGALVQNSAAFNATQPANNAAKIFGLGTFTNNGTNGGDGTIRLAITGNFTANQNERVFADYVFTVTRNGSNSGSVVYEVTGTGSANVFGQPVTLNASQNGTIVPGTQTYSGSAMSGANPFPLSISGTYTAFLLITWDNGTAGDTLTVNIPNNSIDFIVSTVPEPSSVGLFGVGTLLLARRRRG